VDTRPITRSQIMSLEHLIGLLAEGAGAHDSPRTAGAEAVDLLAHALQCAYELSLMRPTDAELVVAGLVHDIGHQLVPGDDAGHGIVAADAVRWLLGDRVARLVEYHVPAKRYLVAVDPDYRSTLSPVSVATLAAQGGPMSAAEIAHHESLPDWAAGLVLRHADEAAKIPGRQVPGLDHWRPVLERIASTR